MCLLICLTPTANHSLTDNVDVSDSQTIAYASVIEHSR